MKIVPCNSQPQTRLRNIDYTHPQVLLTEKQVNNMQLFKFWLFIDGKGERMAVVRVKRSPGGVWRVTAQRTAPACLRFIHL